LYPSSSSVERSATVEHELGLCGTWPCMHRDGSLAGTIEAIEARLPKR